MVVKQFKFLSYLEWSKLHGEIEECIHCKGIKPDCSECNGSGEVTCFECHHTHDCEDCDGTGKVLCDYCDSITNEWAYKIQLARDKILVENYLKNQKAPELVEETSPRIEIQEAKKVKFSIINFLKKCTGRLKS